MQSWLPSAIDARWTLFLDRDGVLNRRIVGDYVRTVDELEVLPGVPAAVAALGRIFGRVVIVTNQRGVGRGLVMPEALAQIHARLREELGGRIDGVYVCPHLGEDRCDCRKPGIGLALQAQRDFPEIDLARSLMIGDSPSDMEFARAAGMHGVLVGDAEDAAFASLEELARALV